MPGAAEPPLTNTAYTSYPLPYVRKELTRAGHSIHGPALVEKELFTSVVM